MAIVLVKEIDLSGSALRPLSQVSNYSNSPHDQLTVLFFTSCERSVDQYYLLLCLIKLLSCKQVACMQRKLEHGVGLYYGCIYGELEGRAFRIVI